MYNCTWLADVQRRIFLTEKYWLLLDSDEIACAEDKYELGTLPEASLPAFDSGVCDYC